MKQNFYLGLPRNGKYPPSLRNFFTRFAKTSQLAEVFGVTDEVASIFLMMPQAIWPERLQALDAFYGAEAGTFAVMAREQVAIDCRQQRIARPAAAVTSYRELLFTGPVTTVAAMVRRGLRPAAVARVLGISPRRAYYLLSHPGQLSGQQLLDLDRHFAVAPDTFATLAYHQMELEQARYRPAGNFCRHWCLRKRRRKHQ